MKGWNGNEGVKLIFFWIEILFNLCMNYCVLYNIEIKKVD